MNISNRNSLNLLDLPNEVLLIIVKQLNMVDVLYSLVDVTERLDQLVLNPMYTRILDMTCVRMELLPDRVYSTDDHEGERICKNVLSLINHQVNELIVDQPSIKRVLHTTDYPQLRVVTGPAGPGRCRAGPVGTARPAGFYRFLPV